MTRYSFDFDDDYVLEILVRAPPALVNTSSTDIVTERDAYVPYNNNVQATPSQCVTATSPILLSATNENNSELALARSIASQLNHYSLDHERNCSRIPALGGPPPGTKIRISSMAVLKGTGHALPFNPRHSLTDGMHTSSYTRLTPNYDGMTPTYQPQIPGSSPNSIPLSPAFQT